MLQFQPSGFGQRVIETSLGVMAYYTPKHAPWRKAGEDRNFPPVLFLHSLGGGSSAYEWSKVYAAFAADYRVIAPDLIGWGQSAHPTRSYRVEDYLLIIRELIERSSNVPATVVASSLTGAIALRLATERPDLFRQLILVCPSGYNDFAGNYSQGIAAQIAAVPVLDQFIYAIGAANEWAVRNFLENFLFAERSRITQEMVNAYLASALQLNAESAALASLRGDLFFDLSTYIPALKTPTVFLWGSQSRFRSPTFGRQLAALNPAAIAAFYDIPNAGVLPHLELPAVVTGLMRSYLPPNK